MKEVLFNTDYDGMHTRNGFYIFKFFGVLLWLEANCFPMHIRRMWWLLWVQEPVFAENGGCGSNHAYMQLYLKAKQCHGGRFTRLGFTTSLLTGKPVLVHPSTAWNVWECRGVWREGSQFRGRVRWVDTVLQLFDQEGVRMGWNRYGALDMSTFLKTHPTHLLMQDMPETLPMNDE